LVEIAFLYSQAKEQNGNRHGFILLLFYETAIQP